jgi:hypothetical protein
MFHHLIVPVHAKYAIMDLQGIALKSIVIVVTRKIVVVILLF